MKTKLLIVPFLLLTGMVFGQGKEEIDVKQFEEQAKKIVEDRIKLIFEENKNRLVTPSVFNQIIKNDFSKIQTASKVSNVTNKYASLDINKEKQTFAISPFIYETNNHLFSINFKGELNGKSVFDFKDRNQVEIGLNYTFFKGSKKFNKPDVMVYEQLYEAVKNKMVKNWDKKNFDDLSIEVESKNKSKDKVKKEFNKELDKYEIALSKEYWTSKRLYWVTLNFTPFSQDNFRYLIENDIGSYKNPYKKSINVIKLSSSFNFYYENKKWIINPSLNLVASNKHNLSEIHSTKQWNKISQLTDDTFISEQSGNVYVLSNEKFSQLLLLDTSIKCVAVSKEYGLGVDVNFSNIKFITPNTSNSISKINEISFGVVIPLKDSKGENTINIVPFYAYKQYIDYEKVQENNLGIKFNIPLNY